MIRDRYYSRQRRLSVLFLKSLFILQLTSISIYAFSHAEPIRLPVTQLSTSADSIQDTSLIEIGHQTLQQYYDFPLDYWQLEAGGAIVKGYNVIVCAPTGAGKTVVGEMALLHSFHNLHQHAIYTTPLKALSNEKYSTFCKTFGRTNIGLSTGDISINKGARISVMTTEVYRNIAWRSSMPVTDVMGTNELTRNAVVVLDEFHYMGLPGRGGVWEESVITSPPHTQIIGLSATLTNARDLASWMQNVTSRTTVLVEVPNEDRPVPLRYLFATKEGLYPLFRDPDAGPGAPKGMLGYHNSAEESAAQNFIPNKGFGADISSTKAAKSQLPRGLQVNPVLKAAAEKRLLKVTRSIERQKARSSIPRHEESDDWEMKVSRGNKFMPSRRMTPREERKERERLLRAEMRRSVPSLSVLLKRLQQKNLLPAIFFIFSRAGCDEAAKSVYQQMKGPRRDPNGITEEEIDTFGTDEMKKQKRKKRFQRGRRRKGDLIEDFDGRSFRSSSNYISEEVMTSLLEESSKLFDEDYFDDTSPLSSKNWDFYSKAGLLTYECVQIVASRISVFNDENPEIAFDNETSEQFLFGVGSHHAGMLPAHKSFVEILYKANLMKAVFATETLAAGINMPCRTTVVCSLAKRGEGSSMNLLETSNLLQMAGRAGRRGMDTDGTCVIVATPFESHDDAAQILTNPVKPVTSQFSPSYALAVNLIARGEGKLDVARQLVGKSFSQWSKRQIGERISSAIENTGGIASDVIQMSAEERFIECLIDILKTFVYRRSAQFDIARIEASLNDFLDREALKKASKTFIATTKMLEMEKTTLNYLETELESFRVSTFDIGADTFEIFAKEDEADLQEQIKVQKTRIKSVERELNRHPFSYMADVGNEIMGKAGEEGDILLERWQRTRGGGSPDFVSVSADDICKFAKSTVVFQRKTRKLANANPGLDPEHLLQEAENANLGQDDSWDGMISITKTLLAYGCLSINRPITQDIDFNEQTYLITPAGVNVGMLGFENSLWAIVSVAGAFDIIGASSKLDKSRDDIEFSEGKPGSVLPKAQMESQQLLSLLRSMSPSEFAGYISTIVSDNQRASSISVVDLFHQLTPPQQRVIQSALLALERIMEIQKDFGVEESARNCILDMSNCEVVTAWAAGCSWSEALEISGSPPGDLVRTLSRVLDAVRQLGNLPFTPVRKSDVNGDVAFISPGIHPDIRRLCREAAKSINRYPVKDPIAFQASDEETETFADEEEHEEESYQESTD